MSAIKRKNDGIIYHYTHKDGLFGILESRSLHLTNIDNMNDPYELKYLNYYLESYKKRNLISKNTVKNVLNEFERIKGYYDVFVFSTSSDKNSQALWTNYPKYKYDGYNIGFNIEKLRKILNNYEIIEENGNLKMFFDDGEIIYSESIKQDIIDKNIKAYIFHHTPNQEDHNYNTDATRTFLYFYSIFFKNENDWYNEKEYRFTFFVEKEYAKRIIETKIKDKKSVPYISLSLHDEEIEHPFEEIIIGAKNDYKNDRNTLYDFLESKPYYYKLKNNIVKSDISILL